MTAGNDKNWIEIFQTLEGMTGRISNPWNRLSRGLLNFSNVWKNREEIFQTLEKNTVRVSKPWEK